MSYGLPYVGSKSRICGWVMDYVPQCTCFVDAFAGGCAVTHAAMAYQKADRYIANDVRGVPRLFSDAVHGKPVPDRWVSREEFFATKDQNDYVRCLWSFGNKGDTYMYSTDIEPYKHAMHCAVVEDSWEAFSELCPDVITQVKESLSGCTDRKQRRLKFQRAFADCLIAMTDSNWNHPLIQSNILYKTIKHTAEGKITSFQAVQNLEWVDRVDTLNGTVCNVNLTCTQGDYRELVIPDGSFVYCDPPYKTSSVDYKSGFNHEAFYQWCVDVARNHPLMVSEFTIDDVRFECIACKHCMDSMSRKGSHGKTERLFRVKDGINWNYPKTL